MRQFTDEQGRAWVASAQEEDTPRHHGRWYMIVRPEDGDEVLMLPEVRWQSRHAAERSIRAMSRFELLRRLTIARGRHDTPAARRDGFGDWEAGGPGTQGATAG